MPKTSELKRHEVKMKHRDISASRKVLRCHGSHAKAIPMEEATDLDLKEWQAKAIRA